jgi:hypothetical protein
MVRLAPRDGLYLKAGQTPLRNQGDGDTQHEGIRERHLN